MTRRILIILPPGWATYEMKDGVINMAKQQTNLIAARSVAQTFEYDKQEVHHEYWFGWFLFLVKKVEANRKLLREEEEPAQGLAAALARGEVDF